MRTLIVLSLLLATALGGCLDDSAPSADVPDPVEPDGVLGLVAHLTDGTVVDLPLDPADVPRMAQRYVAERSAGEPTIAVSREGTAIYPSIAFDAAGGALARTVLYRSQDNGTTWEDVSPEVPGAGQQAQPTSLDPYVYADPTTGRLFTMDLYVGCSNLSWSDDEGDTWTTNPVACGVPVNDHQTLFAGPPVGLTQTVGYPNVLYYCNNQIFESTCSHSLDGGLTFVQGAPVFPGAEAGTEGRPSGVCGGLHGHGHASAATGLVYVPKGHCGQAWVSISQDNGATWEMVLVDDTVGFDGHEAIVSTDSEGNVYYVFLDEDTLPRLSVSTDGGFTWSEPMLVGHPDVTAAKFPSIVAGDEGRIAFLYVGTTSVSGFDAEGEELLEQTWEAYVGFSFDALAPQPTIVTMTAHDPDDPVKRGPCDGRCFGNEGGMYDFLDIDIHPVTGQVWVALVDLCNDTNEADPCNGPDGTSDSFQDARGAVGVQVGGLRLLG